MAPVFNLGAVLLFGVAAYLCGSIPVGMLIAKRRGIDIQTQGSGNVGATNVARSVGKTEGALTLLCDLVKGLLPVAIARFGGFDAAVQATAAVMAVVGHTFPIFLRFAGGKGVATGLGVFLGLAPAAVLTALAGFGVAFALTRIVSFASLVAAAATPVLIFWFDYPGPHIVGGVLVAILIIVRHAENIGRLLHGDEQRFRIRGA